MVTTIETTWNWPPFGLNISISNHAESQKYQKYIKKVWYPHIFSFVVYIKYLFAIDIHGLDIFNCSTHIISLEKLTTVGKYYKPIVVTVVKLLWDIENQVFTGMVCQHSKRLLIDWGWIQWNPFMETPDASPINRHHQTSNIRCTLVDNELID